MADFAAMNEVYAARLRRPPPGALDRRGRRAAARGAGRDRGDRRALTAPEGSILPHALAQLRLHGSPACRHHLTGADRAWWSGRSSKPRRRRLRRLRWVRFPHAPATFPWRCRSIAWLALGLGALWRRRSGSGPGLTAARGTPRRRVRRFRAVAPRPRPPPTPGASHQPDGRLLALVSAAGLGQARARPQADGGHLPRLGRDTLGMSLKTRQRAGLPPPHRFRARRGQAAGARGLAGAARLQSPASPASRRTSRLTSPTFRGDLQLQAMPGGRRRQHLASRSACDERAPIGIFDSGIGGLTVARAMYERLPHESTVYFGDTARVPYGPKSPETVTPLQPRDPRLAAGPGREGGGDRLQYQHRPRARGPAEAVARAGASA